MNEITPEKEGAFGDRHANRMRDLMKTLKNLESHPRDKEWIQNLAPRKLEEAEFHDFDRDEENIQSWDKKMREQHHGNKKFYSVTRKVTGYIDTWLKREVPGKVFLDYACGNGDMAIRAAKAGAALAIGIDISPVSVGNAKRRAEREGVKDRTFFLQADCEETGLPANSIDRVICSGVLHHMDLSYTFPELRRIMAPGGRVLALEALNYNPFIKLYRLMTPNQRTEWEKNHILSLKELRFGSRFFQVENVTYWNLATLLATPFRKTPLFGAMIRVAELTDRVILRVPPIKYLAWMFTFELVKHSNDAEQETE